MLGFCTLVAGNLVPSLNVKHTTIQKRHLIFDILEECHKTRVIQFLERELGSEASSVRSDFFGLDLPTKVGGEEVPIPLDPTILFPFVLYVQIDELESLDLLSNQAIGNDGIYTDQVRAQHQLLAQFWNMTEFLPSFHLTYLRSQDLQGNIAPALEKLMTQLQELIPDLTYKKSDLEDLAAQMDLVIQQDVPNNYANPALSTQAAVILPSTGEIKYQEVVFMVLGQGILDFFEQDLGLGSVGVDFIHAHEFSHGVAVYVELLENDFDYDLVSSTYELQGSDELEADAMAAYALAHPKGGNYSLSVSVPNLFTSSSTFLTFSYQFQALLDVMQVASAIGDRFEAPFGLADHGTPEQRECAIRWGAYLAISSEGTILSSREFIELFDDTFLAISRLDADTCYFPGANTTLVDVYCPAPGSASRSRFIAIAIKAGPGAVLVLCFLAICIAKSSSSPQPNPQVVSTPAPPVADNTDAVGNKKHFEADDIDEQQSTKYA